MIKSTLTACVMNVSRYLQKLKSFYQHFRHKKFSTTHLAKMFAKSQRPLDLRYSIYLILLL